MLCGGMAFQPAVFGMLRQRRPSVHSSCCSASTTPTRRPAASRLGKMPTTSVRQRISSFDRSGGLFDQSFCQWGSGVTFSMHIRRTIHPATHHRYCKASPADSPSV